MTKLQVVGAVLWLMVFLMAGWWMWTRGSSPSAEPVAAHDDRVIVQVPWKHLTSLKPFQLTERSGEEFDSRQLAGRPYVVSFFFASCPSICRDLNKQIQRLHEQFGDQEVTFLSVTVDPETDTPEVLSKYASQFGADPQSWLFLTGRMHLIKQLGQHQFEVVIDQANHTGDLLLVDRWGKFRDRFKWDDPREMNRFSTVLREVIGEQEPPIDSRVSTRNATAGVPHQQRATVPWLNDFYLTDQNNLPFFSRDLTGQVWIGSFFFTSCPGICPRQNQYLAGVQSLVADRGAKLVSISTDPLTDTPAVLRQYANKIGAEGDWLFLTGDTTYIARVGSEFFHASAGGDHHSSLLYVVDRWGQVRATLDWQEPGSEGELMRLVESLAGESVPPTLETKSHPH